MIKKHPSQQVLLPPGKASYEGSLNDYQVNGTSHRGKRYQLVEHDTLNNTQNFLYHRALFGLSVYSQAEIKEMHWEKRERIKKVHKRTQRILNIWKQEIVNRLSNALFLTIFPDNDLTRDLVKRVDIDPDFKCPLSFQALNIKKREVVDKLLKEGILPNNFHELKPEQVCK